MEGRCRPVSRIKKRENEVEVELELARGNSACSMQSWKERPRITTECAELEKPYLCFLRSAGGCMHHYKYTYRTTTYCLSSVSQELLR